MSWSAMICLSYSQLVFLLFNVMLSMIACVLLFFTSEDVSLVCHRVWIICLFQATMTLVVALSGLICCGKDKLLMTNSALVCVLLFTMGLHSGIWFTQEQWNSHTCGSVLYGVFTGELVSALFQLLVWCVIGCFYYHQHGC